MDDSGELITLSGWAIDLKTGLYPKALLLFIDKTLISNVKTSYYGPGKLNVAASIEGPVKLGFIFKIPKNQISSTKDIRVFAFSKSGAISELEYLEGVRLKD